MQAYEGFLEDNHFYPINKSVKMQGRRHVIITVLDNRAENGDGADIANLKLSAEEMNEEEQELRRAWLKRLDEAVGLAAYEELPDFQRSTFMREPVNLTGEEERA